MALTSKLFAGNQALEAAATQDAAHIQVGARGPHVEKIQTALNLLDGAGLKVDGAYGPATAKAVLAYKTKRNIINRSYQTTADNIVGKMTVSQMDQELKALENKPSDGRIQIIPRAQQRVARSSFDPRKLQQSDVVTTSRLSVVGSGKSTNVFPAVFNVPAVSVDPGQTVDIDIKNGKGFTLTLTEFHFATAKPAAELLVPGIAQPTSTFNMNVDNITIKARGIRWGSPLLFAQSAAKGPFATDFLVVNVNDTRPNKFNNPTKPHHHQPVSEPDEWEKTCEEASNDDVLIFTLKRLAGIKASPETVSAAARIGLAGEPMATKHFDHYLSGHGATVNEDANIEDWIKSDSVARGFIAKQVRAARQPGETNVHTVFEFNQVHFERDNHRDSFGTIDHLEVNADFVMGQVEIWFEDTYEWHPTYKLYTNPVCDDPLKGKRNTVFLHAAMVQMKTRGAADYTMRGRAMFDIKLFPGI
jgi:hypothetical protein